LGAIRGGSSQLMHCEQFQKNKNVKEDLIGTKLEEAELRFAIAIHYQIPYPRIYYSIKTTPQGGNNRLRLGVETHSISSTTSLLTEDVTPMVPEEQGETRCTVC